METKSSSLIEYRYGPQKGHDNVWNCCSRKNEPAAPR
jgi:hypothetical protein